MHIQIKDLLLPGGKVELKFFTLSGLSHNIYPSWINITTFKHNQEATLYPHVLTSALLSQTLSQVHLLGSTSPDYQSLPQFLSICKSFKTISYLSLFYVGRRVLHHVVRNNDTVHPQATYLLEHNSLD